MNSLVGFNIAQQNMHIIYIVIFSNQILVINQVVILLLANDSENLERKVDFILMLEAKIELITKLKKHVKL